MKSVTLSEDQAKLVMQCLDLACKSGGLNAAAAILPVAQAIESQLADKPQPPCVYAVAAGEAVAALQS